MPKFSFFYDATDIMLLTSCYPQQLKKMTRTIVNLVYDLRKSS